jgi:hypothetical protein
MGHRAKAIRDGAEYADEVMFPTCSLANFARKSTPSGMPSGRAAFPIRSRSSNRSPTSCSCAGSTKRSCWRKAKPAGSAKPVERRIFPKGKDGIGKNGGVAYEDMRWSRLKNRDPAVMFEIVSEHVFPFLRNMAEEGTAHATPMKGARFTIPTPALLAKVVDLIADLPMADRDTKGDLYEYMLAKIATEAMAA